MTNINDILYCDSCGRYIMRRDGEIINDGRFICHHCLKTEVNERNIDVVVRNVISLLNSVGFEDIIYDNFHYKLVSKDEMQKLYAKSEAVGLHVIENYAISECGISDIKETIYILNHLTEFVFREVVAHEILHSWQTRNYLKECFEGDEDSKKRVEGFAQMGSYLVCQDLLNHRKSYYVEQRLKRTLEWNDPYYGKAFKCIYRQFQAYPGSELQKWYYIIRCARQGKLTIE